MRDVIWTIIIIWIVWRLYDAFVSFSRPKARAASNPYNGQGQAQQNYYRQEKKEGSVNIDDKGPNRQSHFKPDDGEYVDYEEIK